MKILTLMSRTSNGILVNFQNGDIKPIPYTNNLIDYIYIAPDDCEVRYTREDGTTEIVKASRGDIIIKFYERNHIPHTIVVVKNTKWKENLIAMQVEEDKHRAEMLGKDRIRKINNASPFGESGCCDRCDECGF